MSLVAHTKIKTRTLKGFSLGEVLLSAFVLTAGLLAITALISSSLRSSLGIGDSIIAVGLSQEGIELVRNARDNAWASGSADGFTKFSSHKHCRINYNSNPLSALDCNNDSSRPSVQPGRYRLQYTGGLYSHPIIAPSSARFSRYIYIDYNAGQKTALVKSFVYWGWGATVPANIENGISSACTIQNKCVFTEVFLTNWRN